MINFSSPEHNNEGFAGGGRAGGASSSGGESFTVKRMMGRTPGLIKSKFLSVLDSSNGILNGISSKLEGLSLNSQTTTADEDIYRPQRIPIGKKGSLSVKTDTDTEAEDILIEIESRKLKEKRAHEEIKSGRFRHPNILTKITDGFSLMDLQSRTTPASVVSPSSETTDSSRSTTNNASDAMTNIMMKSGQPLKQMQRNIEGGGEAAVQIDVTAPSDDTVTLSSEYDLCVPSSISYDSTDMWIRSESNNSVPSWASTISLDSQTDDVVIEFIRRFLKTLFDNDSDKISLDMKAEFGQVARTESGRLWFARLVNAQRMSKRVDEATFYSLITYFAIILFECNDCDDFSPAKTLMNMCFTFYHEICVPGIEPYREYLYLYLRDQPIWHSLRFWNAAFFDALQCARANKPIPSTRTIIRNAQRVRSSSCVDIENASTDETDGAQSERRQRAAAVERKKIAIEIEEDQRFHENITFGQLGTFTCNMHAFGLSRELCLEFLRKQCTIANLSAEHEKLLKDNIVRMYRETDKWRD